MSRKISIAITLLCLALFAFYPAYAQETRASLGGKVTDPKGALIQKASIVVVADETGVVYSTKTNNAGAWIVVGLLPGHYRFEVSSPGFKTTEHTSIELQLGDQKTVDVGLQMGSRTETVTVEGTTPLIDTTAAVSGVVITTKDIEELPQYGDSATFLAALAPGMKSGTVVAASSGRLWGNIAASNLEMNASGSGTKAINYTINGATDTAQGTSGDIAFVPPMDSVEEMRVEANAYDASIGRSSSATINMQTKAGTKAFHGTLYETNENNFLNANYSQNKTTHTPVPVIRMNEYGAAVGGPVWIPKLYDGRKKKTFFFFDYNAIRNKTPGSTGTMSLPTALEKTGDFSQSFTTSTVGGVTTKYWASIYDPALITNSAGVKARQLINGTGKVIPSGRISQAAKAYLALLPDPENAGDGANTDSNNYVKNETYNDQFHSEDLRVDQNWNNANHSYANLRRNHWTEIGWDPFGPSNVLQGTLQKRVNLGMTLDHTLVLRSNLFVDLRYNLMAWDGSSAATSAGISPTTLGISASNPYVTMQQDPSLALVTGIVSGAENGGLGTNQAASYTNDTNQEMSGSVTQTFKSHTFHYGANFLLQQEGTGGLGQQGGNFAFSNAWTDQNPDATACTYCGSALASMLLDLPTSGTIPDPATAFWSQHYTGFYFQDTWRTTTRLTLNYGLRWDYERPVSERFNRYWNRFDPNAPQTAFQAVAQTGYASLLAGSGASNAGVALLQTLRPDAATFNVNGGIQYAGLNGTSRYVVNPRYKYFQPRLGFAYQVKHDLVLRGGVGRFVQGSWYTGNQEGYSATSTLQPTLDDYMTVNATFSNPYATGRTVLPTGNSLGQQTDVGTNGTFTDPNIGRPYVDEASVYVQKQVRDYLFEVGGTFNITHGLTMGFLTNKPTTTEWQYMNTPTFGPTGVPVATLAGNVSVPNPFRGAPYMTNGYQNNSTIVARVLLDPTPTNGAFTLNEGKGKTRYYALNTKVEKRFHSGFSLHQAFTWSKRIEENTFIGSQYVAPIIDRSLDTADQRFNYNIAPIYELPFGRGKSFGSGVGKGLNEAIGGWEITGIYQFLSGTPLSLPTNSSFFQGHDPSLGSSKTKKQWFDTSKFAPFPGSSITVAQLASQWPSWTGVLNMPGAGYTPPAKTGVQNGVYQDFATWNTYNQHTFGNIRNPYQTTFTLGVRKAFPITETVRFQLRIDAYNALNHPQFGNIDTTPGDTYFGWVNGSTTPTQVNAPRSVQLEGKLYF
jgi:hypothetical protein